MRRWVLPEAVRDAVLECCVYANGTRFALHAAVVMPDHVHVLFTPNTDSEGATFGLSQILNSIKGASSHVVNKALGRTGAVWQSESFDHGLRLEDSVRGAAEYICANPLRAGLVANEDDYPWLWREWVEGAHSEANRRA
jgi:REP element-mobilizing transposase RayT